ncbi:MAG: PEP-CTERM sorting domain-containing protein [Rhodospirillales bacterium]
MLSYTLKWIFAPALVIALASLPLGATPIAAGSATELFDYTATFQVVTNPGGQLNTQPTFVDGATPLGNPVTITSPSYTLTLSNLLTPGSTLTDATLLLTIDTLLTPVAPSLASCQGTNCDKYTLPLVQSDMYSTVITVASTSGTTYTWNYQASSGSGSLNLLTANPGFAADLAAGDDLTISWTQTVTLSAQYTPPDGGANDRCRNCTLLFNIPFKAQTSLSATVDAGFTEPPNPVPEPSTGLLLGLGIMVTAATLRRKIAR